jgi:hypothetical protein
MAAQVGPAIQQWGADLKWPKLPIFDGSYKSFPSWKNQFQLYIDGHPYHFTSDTKKLYGCYPTSQDPPWQLPGQIKKGGSPRSLDSEMGLPWTMGLGLRLSRCSTTGFWI